MYLYTESRIIMLKELTSSVLFSLSSKSGQYDNMHKHIHIPLRTSFLFSSLQWIFCSVEFTTKANTQSILTVMPMRSCGMCTTKALRNLNFPFLLIIVCRVN